MNKKNLLLTRQMTTLSKQIKIAKEARCKLQLLQANTSYFIIEGSSSDRIRNYTKDSISDVMSIEQYLRLSVSNMCKCLDGFTKYMEPIDYISTNDIKNKFVDICFKDEVIASISLSTGEICLLSLEHMSEDKTQAEKVNSITA